MPQIPMQKDNLDERNLEFSHQPLTAPVFLNSVPKSGTHLMRNIMRMFVANEQQYHDTFIQIPIMHNHARAFDPAQPFLSWGHLLFSDESMFATRLTRHILLVRDPYTWVLARARFFISENFEASLDHLKSEAFSPESLLNMMIFGIHGKAPPMNDIYTFNATAWLGTGVHLYRYEDIVENLRDIDSKRARDYFGALLETCGIAVPDDWKQRILIGSDKKQSGTARENLVVNNNRLPSQLPEMQRRLVEVAVPGLRELLGYKS